MNTNQKSNVAKTNTTTNTGANKNTYSTNRPKTSRWSPKKNFNPRFEQRIDSQNETSHLPPLADDAIRIIHLGGLEEVGRNMSCIEYKDSILIIDCGIQFSESHTPGIDGILPNTKYLEENKHKIKGMLITHGHLDHIGALPYILPRIGNPKIYSRLFTGLMIKKRQEEFPHLDPINMEVVEIDKELSLGDFKVRFFAVSHAIPDSMGLIIETPFGNVVHTGDLRLDHDNGVPTAQEEKNYSIFKDMNVLCLMTDSTNCENPGFSISDRVVFENIRQYINNTRGKLIIATFASQVERMIEIIKMLEEAGKKIIVEGRSLKTNIDIAKTAELLKINSNNLISLEDMHKYPDDKIAILATGSQGEEFAVLNRCANDQHKYIKLNNNTTILMSSSVIPGNERAVQNLKDKLSRRGAHLVHYRTSDIHSSGHANHDELVWIHKKIHPKFFIPVHGYHYMLKVHGDIEIKELGMPEENVVIGDNGMLIEIRNAGKNIVALKEYAPNELMVIDGTSVGKIQDVVIRDRQTLAADGMFVIIGILDGHTRKLKKSPDIISRGFVYLKESQDLLFNTRSLAKNVIEESINNHPNVFIEDIKDKLTDTISKFLLQKTNKRPVIIPVLIVV